MKDDVSPPPDQEKVETTIIDGQFVSNLPDRVLSISFVPFCRNVILS